MSARIDQADSAFGGLDDADTTSDGITPGELVAIWRRHVKLLLLAPLVTAVLGYGVARLMPPVFTAGTTFMPPTQGQNTTSAALASLGALGSLAGNLAGTTTPGDRYVALLTSVNVSDSIIDRFKLMEVYDTEFKVDARRKLNSNVRVSLGKKDGLITVAVDDESPQRAADMANRYVEELRRVTATLAVTEAQQRRQFFERHLQDSQARLVQAQQALQASGFNTGALKAEPRAAAESFARLKAETTAAEVRLQTLRSSLADSTPEVQRQLSLLGALRAQLASAERTGNGSGDSADYISRYRDYKYQETLFELYARQFELARVDESREGALFQVVDAATPPEKRTRPQRVLIGLSAAAAVLLLLLVALPVRASLRERAATVAASSSAA